MGIAGLRIDEEGVDDIGWPLALGSGRGPGLVGQVCGRCVGPFDRLHHLTDHAVQEHHDRDPVLVGQVKGFLHEVHHLLDAGRGQDNQPIVAVAAPSCRLEIIALGRLDGAQSGPSRMTLTMTAGSSAPHM